MALRDMFDTVRDRISQFTSSFLHGEDGYAQPGDMYSQQAPMGYEQPEVQQEYQSSYEGAYQQQNAYQPQNAYQSQNTYQQAQQPPQAAYQAQGGYQSPYAGSFAQQQAPRTNRTAGNGGARAAEKVVPFPGMTSDGVGNAYSHELQILQMRDREECKAIIEHLKNNVTVALNMDSIANDTEKQRCVDMLSGAAYTLGCQVSRISPRGVYLIAPATVRVQQDEATRRMNGGARPAPGTRAPRTHGYSPRNSQPDAYESQESGYSAYQQPGYPPQAEYDSQDAYAPGGYQPAYSSDNEYRTAGYYAPDTRQAVGYGR